MSDQKVLMDVNENMESKTPTYLLYFCNLMNVKGGWGTHLFSTYKRIDMLMKMGKLILIYDVYNLALKKICIALEWGFREIC